MRSKTSATGAETVVITGGTSGVGRATARAFAAEGANIAVLARGRDGLEATREELEGEGVACAAIAADVADAESVRAAAYRVERELGPIEIWINNAMTTVFGAVSDIAPAEYRRVTDVTYLGTIWGTKAALEVMVPRGRGTIVQVSSALAHRAIPLQSAYCAAKHAARAFTDSLRAELIREQSPIRLTAVELPGLNTPQFDRCRSKMPRGAMPVPPIYEPEVAARAIYRAAYAGRRDVYVGGSTMKTIWGQALAPGLLDRYLAKTAVEGQQTSEVIPPGRPGNLFAPLAGDPGARGRFSASPRSATAALAPAGGAGFRAAAVTMAVAAAAAGAAGLALGLRAAAKARTQGA